MNNALSEKEISSKEGLTLYKTKGIDFHLVGLVADELRKRRVGNIVSYVVNRNINFTNVCIKHVVFVHLVEILEKKKVISYQQKKLYVEQKKLII